MDINEVMQKRNTQFENISSQCKSLFAEKNVEYKDSFRSCGLIGCACQIVGIGSRLLALVVQRSDHGKSLKDKLIPVLMDGVNYSIMAIMCIQDDNWSGEA